MPTNNWERMWELLRKDDLLVEQLSRDMRYVFTSVYQTFVRHLGAHPGWLRCVTVELKNEPAHRPVHEILIEHTHCGVSPFLPLAVQVKYYFSDSIELSVFGLRKHDLYGVDGIRSRTPEECQEALKQELTKEDAEPVTAEEMNVLPLGTVSNRSWIITGGF